jgi:starch synthase
LAAGVATGFQFTPVTAEALAATLSRALKCFRDAETWRGIQRRGMAADVGWQRPAAQYAALYRSLVTTRGNA